MQATPAHACRPTLAQRKPALELRTVMEHCGWTASTLALHSGGAEFHSWNGGWLPWYNVSMSSSDSLSSSSYILRTVATQPRHRTAESGSMAQQAATAVPSTHTSEKLISWLKFIEDCLAFIQCFQENGTWKLGMSVDIKFHNDIEDGHINIKSFYDFRKKLVAPAPNWLPS